MIPFPRLHIAESVLNRIQNTLEGVGVLNTNFQTPPIVPETAIEGAQLDQSLSATPAPSTVSSPEQEEGAIIESTQGGSPLAGILNAGI